MSTKIAHIFDIDGTLVESTDFDTELFVSAAKRVMGDIQFSSDWNNYKDVTDSAIVRQIAADHGRTNAETIIQDVRMIFGNLIFEYLNEHQCIPIPGAKSMLEKLNSGHDNLVGFATGGWGHTARMKLESAGLRNDNIPLVSSDFHYKRQEIMLACKSLMAEVEHVIYIGDGLWDMKAARDLKWGFIGVGPKLKGENCIWIPDYLDSSWNDAPQRALRELEDISDLNLASA